MNFIRNIKSSILKHKIKSAILTLTLIYWMFCLPKTLFEDPTSTVVESRDGSLLGARIADDGQWRFPAVDSIPKRFELCILNYEDVHFYKHPGFNPVAMSKALWGNLTTDKRRGGSTLTQQVIRLARKNKQRTYFEKGLELIKATRLEVRYSKSEILNLYASHAPFGGNVVGLETASWRYFGVPSYALSWSQSAALAVLPNNPSMVRPGKNVSTFSRKRNQLLKTLWQRGVIDETTYQLAIIEPLPAKPLPLPRGAAHLTERIRRESPGKRVLTTLEPRVQNRLNRLAEAHYSRLKQNEVYNLAVLVMDVNTKEVVGYIGNSPTDEAHHSHVDIVDKARSTGSVLKPFLYAGMLGEGLILPESLVADIPTSFNGYQPENFDKEFHGAVPAGRALARSLNVPAVRMLRTYGMETFYRDLKNIKLGHINQPASYYGLSMILGGAESSLWELTKSYAGLAHTLNTFTQTSSEYPVDAFEGFTFVKSEAESRLVNKAEVVSDSKTFDAGAIFQTLETLRTVNRPSGEEYWEFYKASQPVAWKTGTSFGFKDAWAVGVTPQYAIGVWVGNADGEGRPGLTGIQAAAPLFFDVLHSLPNSGKWFATPFDALTNIQVCSKSGAKASVSCPETNQRSVVSTMMSTTICNYHQAVYLTVDGAYRVNSDCYELDQMKSKVHFVLPPAMEYFYASKHPEYRSLPPMHPDCKIQGDQPMAFMYPKKNQGVQLPKGFDAEVSEVIFKIAHRNSESKVFWYLNEEYLGETTTFHELAVQPTPGEYVLTVVDGDGNELRRRLTVSK